MTDALRDLIVYGVGPALVAAVTALAARGTRKAAADAHDRDRAAPTEMTASERATISGLVSTVGHLSERVERLEGDVLEARSSLLAATGYIRRLLDFIGTHLPGRTDVPEPPTALHDHIEP